MIQSHSGRGGQTSTPQFSLTKSITWFTKGHPYSGAPGYLQPSPPALSLSSSPALLAFLSPITRLPTLPPPPQSTIRRGLLQEACTISEASIAPKSCSAAKRMGSSNPNYGAIFEASRHSYEDTLKPQDLPPHKKTLPHSRIFHVVNHVAISRSNEAQS